VLKFSILELKVPVKAYNSAEEPYMIGLVSVRLRKLSIQGEETACAAVNRLWAGLLCIFKKIFFIK
jgi:hypothetical protein